MAATAANLGLRTTSACAENTLQGARYGRVYRNYLRVRGEYFRGETVSGGDWELPPRARRILELDEAATDDDGTTSACAENTGR